MSYITKKVILINITIKCTQCINVVCCPVIIVSK